MPEADDALPGLMRALAGSTVAFVPGTGGVEDALAAVAFRSLCERHGVAIAPDGDPDPARTTVFGSLAAAAAFPGRDGIVLPSRDAGPEAIERALGSGLTLLLADPAALRLAEIQGVPAERRLPGRDMAHHIDLDAAEPAGAGEGTLRLGVGAIPPGEGDGVAVQLSGADGRWRSPERCRSTLRGLSALIGGYAAVVTDDGALAALAARLGRTVTTAAADAGEAATGDRAPDRLRDAAKAARRDAQTAAQALEASRVELAELRERADAERAAAVAAAERGTSGARLVPASLHERQALDRDAQEAALRERAASAEERLVDAQGRLAEAQGRLADAQGRLAAAEARAAAEAQAAARARAEARERGDEVIGALEAALATRTDQALALQDALDRTEARVRLAEARVAQMQAQDAARDASAAEGRQASARLQRVTSSLSWRLTRPLRVVGRSLRRAAGLRRG